ncbi:2777_t:CDS:1, partial [Gigaspora margarita]
MEEKIIQLLSIAYDVKQLIHLNKDKEKQEEKFLPEPIKFPEPKNNPPEQYRSKAWNIVKLEKEKENYIDSY